MRFVQKPEESGNFGITFQSENIDTSDNTPKVSDSAWTGFVVVV